jgi:hypothetical protein
MTTTKTGTFIVNSRRIDVYMQPPFMIVRENEWNEYTSEDSVDDRLYMSIPEVLARFDELQTRYNEPLVIAGVQL